MTNSASPANGGAMPKMDRGDVMRRAWVIFRQTYKYPQFKFADIGRNCFAWALRQAWAEAREATRLAAIPTEVKAGRIETLHGLIQRASYIDSGPHWKAAITAHRKELRQLQASL
jgi:hypothetical protein